MHGRGWGEVIDEAGEEGGAGGGDEFAAAVDADGGHVGEEIGGGGCGNGHEAVVAFDEAGGERDGAAGDGVDVEEFHGHDTAEHIDDGVHCSDFVEVDFVAVDLMHPGFRVSQGGDDFAGTRFAAVGGLELVDHGHDLGVVGVVVMMVRVAMVVTVAMSVFVRVAVLFFVGGGGEVDFEVDAADAAAAGFLGSEGVGFFDGKISEGLLDGLERYAEVNAGTEHHVASDATERVDVEMGCGSGWGWRGTHAAIIGRVMNCRVKMYHDDPLVDMIRIVK